MTNKIFKSDVWMKLILCYFKSIYRKENWKRLISCVKTNMSQQEAENSIAESLKESHLNAYYIH